MLSEEILDSLSRRPQTMEDIVSVYGEEGQNTVEDLLIEGKISIKVFGGVTYYHKGQKT